MTLIPTQLAALSLGVEPATIRSWVKRGWLINRGTQHRAMFAVMDLRELARRADNLPA